ncbi:hypothetical protein RI196_03720 [Aeribacillus composti]|uniref:Uncharacterized protein n=1 Tax=Aeribacillus composti TaxID=1868734 RepID=A0ABY9WCC9_9BACI|nr:hypothetical protein [Aeribacillus composti]WNF33804.1 hypothetical protein RI196_03720 [Aeribacillus composti]
MTVGEMLQYTNRFKEIMNGPNSLRDSRLVILMSDLEQAYNIPTLRDQEFEKQNPYLMQLYRTVSEARSI